jgi:hypothetical protein
MLDSGADLQVISPPGVPERIHYLYRRQLENMKQLVGALVLNG